MCVQGSGLRRGGELSTGAVPRSDRSNSNINSPSTSDCVSINHGEVV